MSSTAPAPLPDSIRQQLLERRERLAMTVEQVSDSTEFRALLDEVDAALARVSSGTYGICETCHDPIEPERLAADPLLRFCVDHLSEIERRALEEDIELASRIQRKLLPHQHARTAQWEAYYHYAPAGPVGGDYCDLVIDERDGELFFVFGDASGKGVAASMLTAHLHTLFRTLHALDLPLDQLIARANRIFCETMLSGQYATLVCGRASAAGTIELANAGHWPPLLLRAGQQKPVEATGVPLGLFATAKYGVRLIELLPGESLLLYTDGLTEARNPAGLEYGTERFARFAALRHKLAPEQLLRECLADLAEFQAGARRTDDLTLMALQRLRPPAS
jgi:sigma-B regulation protein RsbU (phosphoserine phosphatase)